MSVIRVGSSGTYAEGWDAIFGGGAKRGSGATSRKSTGKKKPAAGTTKAKATKSVASRKKPSAKVGKRKSILTR